MNNRWKNAIYSLILIITTLSVWLWRRSNHTEPMKIEGKTMGTTYHITYFDIEKRDFKISVDSLLTLVNKSINTYDPESEVSKFNKGKSKVYLGVPGNLVAFACKVSVDKGYEGFLAFDAKTALIKHYEQYLLATHFRGLRMFIETSAALRLISQYFKS